MTMRLPIALLFALGGVCAPAAEPVTPSYAESAFPAAARAAMTTNLTVEAMRCRSRSCALDDRIAREVGAPADADVAAVRIGKRREVRDRAQTFAEANLRRGGADGLGFAEQALADVEEINRLLEDELRFRRTAPSGANRPVVLNVRDFGAVGDGKADDSAAFARANAALGQLGGAPTVLRIPAGTYRLVTTRTARPFTTAAGEFNEDPWVRTGYCLFDGLQNCRIEGDGPEKTRLRSGYRGQQLALVNCVNCTVKGLELATEEIPFLEGDVLAYDRETFACDIRLKPGTLRPDDPKWHPVGFEKQFGVESFGVEFDKSGNLIRTAALLCWRMGENYKDLGDGRWRLFLDGKVGRKHLDGIVVGGTLALPNRTNAYGAFAFRFCTFCTAEDVWVRTSRSSAFCTLRSRGSTFDRCRLFPLDGHSLSSNADGCFCDPGTFVYRCSFDAMCDDGLNVRSRALVTAPGRSSSETLHLDNSVNRGGALVAFADPKTGQYLANAALAQTDAAVFLSNGWRRVSRFARALPPGVAQGVYQYEPRQFGVGTVISGCSFRNGRWSGSVIQSPQVLIEDCTFEGIRNECVRLGALGNWREGPPPYAVLIRSCRFAASGTGVGSWIEMFSLKDGTKSAVTVAPVRGVDIEDCVFERLAVAPVSLKNATDVRLVGNRVDGAALSPERDVVRQTSERVSAVKSESLPAFGFRAFMLDEARHFFGKEKVKQYLDVMRRHRYNYFHWHLTDDQGWRIDVPGFPELVRKGAKRPATPLRGQDAKQDGRPYGPYFYSEADIREIVDYAKARGIEVIPEIDMPGHVGALLASHPELACAPDAQPGTPRVRWGVSPEVLCVGNEAVYAYLERLVAAVARLFPCDYFHIGGDECPRTRWEACDRCRGLMAREGMGQSAELQAYFVRRVAAMVARCGKKVIGWDEILEAGELPKGTIVQNWRSASNGVSGADIVRKAVEKGCRVIMSPLNTAYFTQPTGEIGCDPWPYREWTMKLKLTLPSARVARFSPLDGIPPELHGVILGGECCAWSEEIDSGAELDYKIRQRLELFGDALYWSPASSLPAPSVSPQIE